MKTMVEKEAYSQLAVVIPAYNEVATIRGVVERALSYCGNIIVVDDGSKDGTSAQLDGLPITLIRHDNNRGKAASLWDGFHLAMFQKAEHVITLDGDGQHAPEDIPLLLAQAEVNPGQIIIGARLADKAVIPFKRYAANRFANFWIAWAAGYHIRDSQSGFRLYPVNLFRALSISTSRHASFVFESEILIKAAERGIYSQAVKVTTLYPPNARPSHFRGVRDIALITCMVTRHLLIRGLYLQGLYRSLFARKALEREGLLEEKS